MAVARYVTHPEIVVDPGAPVPDWRLSDVGRARATAFAALPELRDTDRIVSSEEAKAVETADIIGRALDVVPSARAAMHENDRSATGYLVEAEFQATADAFFARPTESVRGWERAVDAQARILREVDAALAARGRGDVLFVGHGGVGALLLCALSGGEISRAWDQPNADGRRGGYVFAFDVDTRAPIGSWRPIDQPASP